jgi:hypothetical protein
MWMASVGQPNKVSTEPGSGEYCPLLTQAFVQFTPMLPVPSRIVSLVRL